MNRRDVLVMKSEHTKSDVLEGCLNLSRGFNSSELSN